MASFSSHRVGLALTPYQMIMDVEQLIENPNVPGPGDAGIELAGVGVSPPIRERAFRVVFASIIIKGMGQLMTDNSANAPVVDRAISRRIEIWSLQLPSWQHHLIEVRAVIAVYGLRGRTPFIAIDQ
jgi:hypothetical protein